MPSNPILQPPAAAPGTLLSSLDTPAMVVDIPLMERNIATLTSLLLPTGVKIRPHLKTTKSAALANKLIAAGCTGGCVAKVSEAEAVIAAGGSDDLLITSPVVGRAKVRKLVELWREHRGLRVVVDSVEGARGVDEAVAEAGLGADGEKMAVLVDVDVGLHRTGVQPGSEALKLARYVRDELKRLRIIGVQGYEGHLQHVHSREERKKACLASMEMLVSTARMLKEEGFEIEVVTTGGTGTAEFCAAVEGVTEVQPGSFIFMDTDYQAALKDKTGDEGSGWKYGHSLSILATVISKQGPRRVTIDAGLKSLTTDSGLAECKDGRYRHENMGDEHGSLTWDEGTPDLALGDRVYMLPSHIDPTVNLHEFYYGYRDGVVEEFWRVDSRGCVQ